MYRGGQRLGGWVALDGGTLRGHRGKNGYWVRLGRRNRSRRPAWAPGRFGNLAKIAADHVVNMLEDESAAGNVMDSMVSWTYEV